MSWNHSFAFTIEHPEDNALDEEITGEISVTSYGHSGSWDDPPEGPEWEIDELRVNDELISYWLDTEKKVVNPRWNVYEPLVVRHIENDFDWSDAQAGAAEDYYDYYDER